MKQDYSTIPPAHRDIASRQATVGVSSKVNPILSRIISSYKIWLFILTYMELSPTPN